MDYTTLPAEVFETILTYLDLDSVKALRLTDRRLAKKCLGPRFLGSIQQPNFDVSLQNLRSLHALACNPALKKVIHSLTFLATSLDTSGLEKNIKSGKYTERRSNARFPFSEAFTATYSPEELANIKSDLNWLREKQKARAEESPSEMIELLQLALEKFGELDSIHLDGMFFVGRTQRESAEKGEWHPLWMRASHIFSLVVAAMVQSKVSVKKLDVYRNTPRCNIPSNHITTYISSFNPEQLGILGKGLESFQLSIAGEIQDNLPISESSQVSPETLAGHLLHDDPRAALADGTPGITSLLKSMPALRELDLSFRNTLMDGELNSYDRIIESIAYETQFPILEKCALSGFLAKGESILLFLQKHPNLHSFTLHECTLTTGSWTPIFSHLDQSMPRLENLNLSNLFGKHMENPKFLLDPDGGVQEEEEGEREVDGIVNLRPIWDTNRPSVWTTVPTRRGQCVHTRSFTRQELKRGLVFRPLGKARGRSKSSPEGALWVQRRSALYGPP